MTDKLKLVPLRVPSGWKVELNKFTEVNPDEFTSEDYKYLWEFDEDIVYLTYKDKYSIDLGWYPSFNPKGEYSLLVIKDNDWDYPLEKFHSRRIDEIKEKLELYLEKYNS